MAEAGVGAAVELRGLPPDVPDLLLMLYFENRRRSGGGPVLSWQRLGGGGILTFQDPADAVNVLARTEHQLQGARLSLRAAPPRAPARLLLQGLPPGTAPGRLERHVQALLGAVGLPVPTCQALASPRPDRSLVQLSTPISEAEVRVLEDQAHTLGLDGASVSVARVPQARAVRVVGGTALVDPLLLELYLENERRSGGGPLEGLRTLPRQLGTVVSFQHWQAAERVLQREHWLQGSTLSLVPHYDVLDPEELAGGIQGGDHPVMLGPGATGRVLLGAGRSAEVLLGSGTAHVSSGQAPGQSGASVRSGPVGSPGQDVPVDLRPVAPLEQEGRVSLRPVWSLGQEAPVSLGTTGSPEQSGFTGQAPVGSAGPVSPVEGFEGSLGWVGPTGPGFVRLQEQEGLVQDAMALPGQGGLEGPVGIRMESPEKAGLDSPGGVELQGREDLVETVLSMEPGAMRFLQLYHGDLLASLGEVTLFPLEGMDSTGFWLYGAPAPCQAARELLQSLLGGISCHVLSLTHPGSARFLLGAEGQQLLRGLEAQFQCVFGTERLASATLDVDPEEGDPTEALQVSPGHGHALWPPDSTGGNQENVNLEKVQELLSTLKGLDGEPWRPLQQGEEKPPEQPEEVTPGQQEEEPAPRAEEQPVAPGSGAAGWLEEEAVLQLALHRSLEPQGQVAEQEEAAALRQALALSLLERPPSSGEAEEHLGGAGSGRAQLVVHTLPEQDVGALEQALVAALEVHLREETVQAPDRQLPAELRARLERCHGVTVALRGNCAVLSGFGAQPARAARHLAALLAGPWDQSLAFPWAASSTTLTERSLKGPLGRLEGLAESTSEFQEVVQAFCDTLDADRSSIRIVRVERVSHPLLQKQYELHLERLAQRCEQRPAERMLYHGTSASAVPDICAHGFNRSFCGRNGTLYGQGVYFAERASMSVQDCYSPPNADGHKAVFAARVLTGDYGQGGPGLRAPPLRAPGHSLLRYDSAVDCLYQPSIFVIFHDTQALPTHLITCERTPRALPGAPLGLTGPSPDD